MSDPAYAIVNEWEPTDFEVRESVSARSAETLNNLELGYLLRDSELFYAALQILENLLAFLIVRAYDIAREFALYLAGAEDAAYA